MAGQVLSPSNSMKLKNVNAARKIKNGSPKIRDVLRQRCRQRMHERRNELFIIRRHGLANFSQEVKETLTNIVNEEFDNMVSMDWKDYGDQAQAFALEGASLEIEEEIEENWILEEYQKMLWEQKQIVSMIADDVVCPICLKSSLREIPNLIICDCGLRLPVQTSLQHLKLNLQEQVNAHSSACLSVPKFSMFQEGDNVSLCLSCMSCDIFAFI